MNTPNKQMLVFTGLDGAMIVPDPNGIQVILPALELLHSREIPHIVTSVRSTAEIAPILAALDHSDPFIVENGAAIHIPTGRLKVNFPYQKTVNGSRVVEFGTSRQTILGKLEAIRRAIDLEITAFSELDEERAAEVIGLDPADFPAALTREYSEPIIFDASGHNLTRLQAAVEEQHLLLVRHNHLFVLTGEHDVGSAVSFLLQLYREEYPGTQINSIGLGDNVLSASMFYAVDTPILVRQPGGRFDDRVGRLGMKFTREPGSLGWNQAVIALVTEDPDA